MKNTQPTPPTIEYLGGNCPVQAEGCVDGHSFYFRARGEHWSLSVSKAPGGDAMAEDAWFYREYFDEWPNAGWMEKDEAREKLLQACERWRQERDQALRLARGVKIGAGSSTGSIQSLTRDPHKR